METLQDCPDLGVRDSPGKILDHEDEFVPSQPCQKVGFPKAGPDSHGEIPKEGIPCLMAMIIVDGLEIVEVDNADRDGGPLPHGPGQDTVEVGLQGSPVGQARQIVMAGFEGQTFSHLPNLGHITVNFNKVGEFSGLISDGCNRDLVPEGLPVFPVMENLSRESLAGGHGLFHLQDGGLVTSGTQESPAVLTGQFFGLIPRNLREGPV